MSLVSMAASHAAFPKFEVLGSSDSVFKPPSEAEAQFLRLYGRTNGLRIKRLLGGGLYGFPETVLSGEAQRQIR
jgi:hypothetical protein